MAVPPQKFLNQKALNSQIFDNTIRVNSPSLVGVSHGLSLSLTMSLSMSMTARLSVTARFLITGVLIISFLITGCQSSHETGYSYRNMDNLSYQQRSANSRAVEAARIRTQMAGQYLLNNQLDDAKQQLEKAFLAHKSYVPAYDMMGLLLQREGSALNIARAEAYFLKAIEIDPTFMQAHNNYGVYLSNLGRYQSAIDHFQIAGSTLGYAGRIKALENLGVTALKNDDQQLASQAFVRVLESDRHNLLAHIELVDLLINSDKVAQARNLHHELILIVGDNVDSYPRIVAQGIRLDSL